MSLQQWLDNSWIRRIEPSGQEVANLLTIADRELSDASLAGMSADGQFDHAYNAVRILCQVTLHAAGFGVPKGESQHQKLIDSLKFTLGDSWAEDADYFDQCRRRRHKAMYERSDVTQPKDAAELLDAARKLRRGVQAWLERDHSGLV